MNNSGRLFCELISFANASQMLGRSTEWMASNSATASFALLDCNGPIRCNAIPGQADTSAGHFAFASCTRFSPNTRCPASMTGEMAAASNVFDTAISVTDARSRCASLHARAMSCSTWARPFGKDLVSGVAISLASCPDFRPEILRHFLEFYQVRERLFETFALPSDVGGQDVWRYFQPQSGQTQEASGNPGAACDAGRDAGGALDAGARPLARRHPRQADRDGVRRIRQYHPPQCRDPARGDLLSRDDAEIGRLYPGLQRHRAQLRNFARQPARQSALDPQHHAREQGRRGPVFHPEHSGRP